MRTGMENLRKRGAAYPEAELSTCLWLFFYMIYRLLADTVVIIHLLFILFVLFGGLLGLWRKWVLLLHFPALVWGVAVEFANLTCPLTHLENHLRGAGGERGYSGGFIEHYLEPVIYPPGLTPAMQTIIGIIVLLINGTVYLLVWWRLHGGGRLRRIAPLQEQ